MFDLPCLLASRFRAGMQRDMDFLGGGLRPSKSICIANVAKIHMLLFTGNKSLYSDAVDCYLKGIPRCANYVWR
jgi:hypothetical protein